MSLCAGILLSATSFSQSSAISGINATFDSLMMQNKLEESYQAIEDYLRNPKLTENEHAYGYFLFSRFYVNTGQYTQSIKASKKSLELFRSAKKPDHHLIAVVLNELANTYFTMRNYQQADYYARQSLRYATASQFRLKASSQEIIGYYYYRQQQPEKALLYFHEASKNLSQTHHMENLQVSLNNKLLDVLNILGKQDEFERVKQENEQLLKELDDLNATMLFYKTLEECSEQNKDYKAAFYYHHFVDSLTEILSLNQINVRAKEIEAKYQNRLTQAENLTLKRSNELKSMQIKNQQIAFWLVILVIGLLLIILLILLTQMRQRNRLNRSLSEQQSIVQSQNSALEHMDQLNKRIFSMISHDFRGPFATLQLLLKQQGTLRTPEEFDYFLQDLTHQLTQINEMTDNLLTWGKAELHAHPLQATQTLLCEIVERTREQLLPIAERKNVHILVHGDTSMTAPLHPDILNIILRNLLSNAIKFSFPDSDVHITWDQYSIRVTDLGVGIPENKRPDLFSKHVHPGVGTGYEVGFGLGLHLCAVLLEKYGGRIEIDPNSNKETTFIVWF